MGVSALAEIAHVTFCAGVSRDVAADCKVNRHFTIAR
jgi:hypothetical protein